MRTWPSLVWKGSECQLIEGMKGTSASELLVQAFSGLSTSHENCQATFQSMSSSIIWNNETRYCLVCTSFICKYLYIIASTIFYYIVLRGIPSMAVSVYPTVGLSQVIIIPSLFDLLSSLFASWVSWIPDFL